MANPLLPADVQAETAIEWRLPLLFALPAAALAFLIGWILDAPSGQGTAFDSLSYPLALVLLITLTVVLKRAPQRMNQVVTILVVAMSVFFLSKLVFILFVMPQTYQVELEMTETFFWIPALQVLSFFIPNLHGARQSSIAFFSLFFLVSVAYFIRVSLGTPSLGIVYALLEMNVANLGLFIVTNTFIGFKEKYVRSIVAQDTMRRLIVTDVLTELPNREGLNAMISGAIAERQNFSLLFIDLDGFKLINDTLGHVVGDHVLQHVAQRLLQRVGPRFFAARLSGDEFVVLLFLPDSEVSVSARALLNDLSQPVLTDGNVVQLSASIGVSIYPKDGADAQSLIQHADSAMYTVKTMGKQGIRRFEPDIDAGIERLQLVERALLVALSRNEMWLMYQPICSLSDGVVRKLETLLRWTHPTLGAVSAAEFIPVAENNGQIIPLGNWVLRAACRQARRWNDETGLAVTVCVNVSPLQFAQPDFVESVRDALREANLPASALEIELTESAVMRRMDLVKAALRELQGLGVKIAIDDFGTGYSSLSYLRDLPINCIKIDKSFIHDLSTPRRAPQFALAIIEAVIGIAETLELQVVAEGVETSKQLEMLRDLGCDLGQGYFLSPPLAEDAALEAFITPALFQPRTATTLLH
jgi:diguanylate cyclase (GGDEF)-like protein